MASIVLVFVASLGSPSVHAESGVDGPTFTLGSRTLASLIPDIAGQPLEDERHNPLNGDGLFDTRMREVASAGFGDRWKTALIIIEHGGGKSGSGQFSVGLSQVSSGAAPLPLSHLVCYHRT